jgi:hypothetical protein
MDYEFLTAAVGGVGPASHRHASAAARDTVREWAIAVLLEVADEARPVRAVTHPLGFTCLPVERAGLDGVCVHLWSPLADRATPTTSAIHSHCWELTSYALFGQMENRTMAVADAAAREGAGAPAGRGAATDERGPYQVLGVRSEGEADEIVPTGRLVRCIPGQRQVITDGDVYSVPAGVFHVTEVGRDAEAATVALGHLVPGIPDLCLGSPDSTPHRVRRRRCDARQTASVARLIVDRLLTAGRRHAFSG